MMNEEQNNKKPLLSKEKKILIVRFILFVLFACILPFTFIAWRYEMFRAKPSALTGWGFFGVIIVGGFSLYVLKKLKLCFPHTMMAQCIGGFCAVVLPLLALSTMIDGIKENIDAFSQALKITILCECIAIPVNPLPKIIWDNNIQLGETILDKTIKKLKEN